MADKQGRKEREFILKPLVKKQKTTQKVVEEDQGEQERTERLSKISSVKSLKSEYSSGKLSPMKLDEHDQD